jgi:hypothetical protein
VLAESSDVLGGEHRATLRFASGVEELVGIRADPSRVQERPARRVDSQSVAEGSVLVRAMSRSVKPDPGSQTEARRLWDREVDGSRDDVRQSEQA